ncbi:ABC transporter ATP-binding protein [Mitsuaria sp. WAJ17]|uniref:ABC transporter ATP-binding protein n=1 Tax=Mitsuaria sp. WAJ17 TaxID=2761452 RepID=UPI0016041EC0|nr:ABC transporter ATP-binding protein [Mitsuaria sp. WAJ17]MBB2484083.1 ABC transporter ATP-binding protein [Mitsuaria sp. WAJ17]
MAELLRVEGLVKRFGALRATDEASFEVTEGEVHALIGPNGAGKTTLIHQIAGSLRPDGGCIRFRGQDLAPFDMAARVQAGLVRSHQITSIFARCSVLDNLVLAVQTRRGGARQWWQARRGQIVVMAEAEALAQKVGLSSQLERAAGSLSHAEQRQLEIGLALAAKPRLLLLDEPMAGMGPDESERMLELLQLLRLNMTLLLVEHDMDAVFRLATRISVLVGGRVIASGTPEHIRTHAGVREAYLGDEMGDEAAAEALP